MKVMNFNFYMVQRETGFLTTATLDAKEISIKIERYIL
jgi:hypothetical protein